MKVKLVFHDWVDELGKSVYNNPVGLELAKGDFHSGSTFEVDIKLDGDAKEDLRCALKSNFHPVFFVVGD